MASIDLRDTYFRVPFHQTSWKYLCFVCENTGFQF